MTKRNINRNWFNWNGQLGRVCWLCGPAVSVGMKNGLRPGRARHPDKPWRHETELGGGESDDLAAQRAQARDHCPKGRTSDPELRADQESCGTVGARARTVSMTGARTH
jgi:hypothetical protein